jgi:hypothetical protein
MKNNIIYLALGLLLAMNTGCGADEESTDDGDMAGDTAGEMTAGETTAGESTAGDSAAGETAGDTAGETAGDSSAGTVAAGESAAGEMMVVDGGTCEAPYEFTDAGDGSSTAEGVLSGDDSSGSCSSPDVDVAEDAVVHFTAPEAGTYRFDTISSFGLDTIIYL